MVKIIQRVGNSRGLILDQATLEALRLKLGSKVQLTVRDGVLIVSPVESDRADDDSVDAATSKVLAKRSRVMRRLA
jgi:antitoxin component of MazEF toxin-antitoxin module